MRLPDPSLFVRISNDLKQFPHYVQAIRLTRFRFEIEKQPLFNRFVVSCVVILSEDLPPHPHCHLGDSSYLIRQSVSLPIVMGNEASKDASNASIRRGKQAMV